MDLATANAYFSMHLSCDDWLAATETSRNAALAMAETDIAQEIGRAADNTDLAEIGAVCEQSLWLLTNTEAREQKRGQVVSENIDGIGSRSYAAKPGTGGYIAPRAKRFIAVILDAKRGTVRTVR